MPMLVAQFVLAGTKEEVPHTRSAVVDQVQAWGVEGDDDLADTIALVTSELVTNAVVYGRGPIRVGLHHRPGRLVIDVHDGNRDGPLVGVAGIDDEGGRGLALVGMLTARLGWEPVACGKHAWAEIPLPGSAPAIRATVLRRYFASRPSREARQAPRQLAVAGA
jgi:anti-sigma regulatory factor (Ser/Thr protein kinase)